MAAPPTTPLGVPGGIFLKQGYKTALVFAVDTDFSMWEKSVKPPGLDGGDPVDNTTMRTVTYRIMRSRSLKTLTPASGKAAYDPDIVNQGVALINVETSVTIHLPELSSYAFYCFLQSLEFDELVEGTQPELTYTIQPTNWDPVNNVEAGPVLTSVAGT